MYLLNMAQILLGIFLSLTAAASDTSTVNRYIREATEWMDSKPDTSVVLAESALELSRRLGYREGEAHALSRLGIARHVTGVSNGMDELNEALSIFEADGHEIQVAWTLVNMANFHIDKGDYVTSTEMLQDAMTRFERLDFSVGVAGTLVNLGEIRAALDQPDEAYELTQRALVIYERLDHLRGRSLALHRLGGLKIRLGQPSEAIPLLKESLKISQSREDFRTIGNTLEALGLAHERLGELETSLVHYRASLGVRERIDDRIDIIGSKNGIAKTLLRMGDATSAKPYAIEAYNEATRLNVPKHASEAARLLYELHKATGDTKTSLMYLEAYQTIRDELFSAEKATAIANLEAVASLRNKEEQIRLLENQRLLERILLASVIGLLALTIGFVVYAMRERKRVICLANKLKEVGAQKDRILSIVSHDLRGPLASLSSVIELLDMDLLSPDDWKELKPSLIRQFNGTDETLQDLLTWAKSQFEGADPRIQSTSLRDAVDVSEELLDVVARQKGIVIANHVGRDAMVMCDRSHLLAIVRNLVANAVKFSQPGQTVTIQDGITDGMRILSVRDEGVGMSPERRDNLFDGAGHTTLGTSGESGSGLGLVFVRDLVQRNGGRISVESTEGKGSVFTVALPMG
jgi:signal transduction histidine kinase